MPRHAKDQIAGMLWMGLVFIVLGSIVLYVFTLPYLLGWTGQILPGAILALPLLVPIGVFMIIVWCIERSYARKLVTA